MDAAGGAEAVFGCFAGELVDGEVFVAVELDVFFGRVDPELGILSFFFLVSWKENDDDNY